MKLIDCGTRKFPGAKAMVDDEYFERLSAYRWMATRPQKIVYAVRSTTVNGKKTMIRMHREILGADIGQIDHVDGNGLNNTRANLRECTNAQNQHNRKRTRGASRYKGVSWHKGTGKWRATIVLERKQKSLGYFDRELDAANAYNVAALKNFGEFASINEI